MKELIRQVAGKVRGLIQRVTVDKVVKGRYQVLWGPRVSTDIAYMQPQGIFFWAVSNGNGLLVTPGANRDAGVLICAQGAVPKDAVKEGEGGLHYQGTFKVFLKEDGTLALGAYAPTDWVARASVTDDEFNKVKQDLDNFKQKFDAHIHSTPVGPSGPPQQPFDAPHTPSTVASETVKLEP